MLCPSATLPADRECVALTTKYVVAVAYVECAQQTDAQCTGHAESPSLLLYRDA